MSVSGFYHLCYSSEGSLIPPLFLRNFNEFLMNFILINIQKIRKITGEARRAGEQDAGRYEVENISRVMYRG
jgi:hypothetical protein